MGIVVSVYYSVPVSYTHLHEAVAMIPAPTPEQKGQVIDCVRTGYMLHDKVLRHEIGRAHV